MDKTTQTDRGCAVGTQTYPGVYPTCTARTCRYKRNKLNAHLCVCEKTAHCECCPNGCYWRTLVGAYPELRHGAHMIPFCGVCKDCTGVRKV